jgi:hypothetical protein
VVVARRPEVFVRPLSMEEGRKLQRISRTEKDPIKLRQAIVVLSSAVAEALGLPGTSVEAARRNRYKLLIRQAHERHGAAHPDFALVTSAAEAVAVADRFGYSVIIKPTLRATSNFVFQADDAAEVTERFAQASAGIRDMSWYRMEADGLDLGPHGLLIESLLDGEEFLIEALARDGEVYLDSVVDRVTNRRRHLRRRRPRRPDDAVPGRPLSRAPGRRGRCPHAGPAAQRDPLRGAGVTGESLDDALELATDLA